MLGIVTSHDDELALLVEIKDINDIETARSITGAGRTYAAAENQPEDIDEEQCGEKKRDDCAEDWKKL
jgi:ribosomal 30S subunit maturation factor RimM